MHTLPLGEVPVRGMGVLTFESVDLMRDELEDGAIVRLGDLGSLRISISSNGETEEKDVTANSIKGAKCIFTPGSSLKKMLNNLTYEKTVKKTL